MELGNALDLGAKTLPSQQFARVRKWPLSGGFRDDRNPSALGSQADMLAGGNFFQPAAAKVEAPPRSDDSGDR
jgi:hypothetical protein